MCLVPDLSFDSNIITFDNDPTEKAINWLTPISWASRFILQPIVQRIICFLKQFVTPFFSDIAEKFHWCAEWHEQRYPNAKPLFGCFWNLCVNGSGFDHTQKPGWFSRRLELLLSSLHGSFWHTHPHFCTTSILMLMVAFDNRAHIELAGHLTCKFKHHNSVTVCDITSFLQTQPNELPTTTTT
ncbi:uncharacterized protein LACBIDRAFT_322482 [Laccaria bicolor S238N-H82]|uniref:Predicted protein n=1 Tax=Laccaria bicolor (strain S238N-H82 / ATCC MYA-4686) TaxID=486041 RepID=B0CWG2_LACBS|nr:uncharacterized protein LACBIDRAFT_322482 [Laccaria bicolor S238N-H82]EDR13503.1 predicted protein [Laccaria bicolor S238N-H82]|eukprot:XP_001876001.1 predicted protein [Laccaria bicolor S238N-H82]